MRQEEIVKSKLEAGPQSLTEENVEVTWRTSKVNITEAANQASGTYRATNKNEIKGQFKLKKEQWMWIT